MKVLLPRKASERTRTRTLTARLIRAKVTTWMISKKVSGWRQSKEKKEGRKKRRKLMYNMRGIMEPNAEGRQFP